MGMGRLTLRVVLLVLALCVVAVPTGAPAHAHTALSEESQTEDVDLEVFAREDCQACQRARVYLDDLQRERPGLRIRVSDILEDPTALARLRSLSDARGLTSVATPTFAVRGQLIVGWADRESTGRRIEALLDAAPPPEHADQVAESCSLETSCVVDAPIRDAVSLPVVGQIQLAQLGLPLFTAILGLLDGFNPCAMWVLLFILSLLAGTRRRATMLIVAGTFVFVSGAIYFAFMAAWLNVFLLVGWTREIQIALGLFALTAGALNSKDYLAFGRGPSLGIPAQIKPSIYRRVNRVVHAERLWLALFGVATLAVLVNAVELLCTAGLPAIYTQVLGSQQLATWQYYTYLGVYQVFYMLDDTIMLTIGIVTLSRHRLQVREGRWLKLVSGAVMLGLGGLLLFQPSWLAWTA